jgi:hypothetical protein
MSARPRRRNARTRGTWPDGSGCQNRPLYPHAEGCPGWEVHTYDDEIAGELEIKRCKACRCWDDNADAANHVAFCSVCQADAAAALEARNAKRLAELAAARARRKKVRPLVVLGSRGFSDEQDFSDWLQYFIDRIDYLDRYYFGGLGKPTVDVEASAYRDKERTRVEHCTDDEREAIEDGIASLLAKYRDET